MNKQTPVTQRSNAPNSNYCHIIVLERDKDKTSPQGLVNCYYGFLCQAINKQGYCCLCSTKQCRRIVLSITISNKLKDLVLEMTFYFERKSPKNKCFGSRVVLILYVLKARISDGFGITTFVGHLMMSLEHLLSKHTLWLIYMRRLRGIWANLIKP